MNYKRKLSIVLSQMSSNSMKKAASETLPTDVIFVDGAWNHWRGRIECQVVIINLRTN